MLLKSGVDMGNGLVAMCFCLLDAALLTRRLHGKSHVDVTMMYLFAPRWEKSG